MSDIDRCPCGIFDECCEHCQHHADEIELLQKRIEELEAEAGVPAVAAVEAALNGYFITDSQIDAAWRQALGSAEIDYAHEGALIALEKLGIVGCEDKSCTAETWSENQMLCPDCNGHGWRKE